MARPEVTETTERLFGLLEPFRRAGDETQDWSLLRFTSVTGDLLDEVRSLIEAYDRKLPDEGGEPGETSALVDPAIASPEVLPWLGQFFGVTVEQAPLSFAGSYGALSEDFATYTALSAAAATYGGLAGLTTEQGPTELTTEELRAAITTARSGWRIASRGAMKAAVRDYLTGTQRIDVIPSYGGDRWAVRVRTYASESPRAWAHLLALKRARAIPVGVDLQTEVVAGASYGQLGVEYPTYAAMTGTGFTYAQLGSHVPASWVP